MNQYLKRDPSQMPPELAQRMFRRLFGNMEAKEQEDGVVGEGDQHRPDRDGNCVPGARLGDWSALGSLTGDPSE